MENISESSNGAPAFPNYADRWAHGSILKGEENIAATRGLPENAVFEIQNLLSQLSVLYTKAKTLDRRVEAKTEEQEGSHANPRTNKPLEDLKTEAYGLELRIHYLKELKRAEAREQSLDLQLAAAVAESTKFVYWGKIGDYLAIINHELETDDNLHNFEFRNFKYVSQLVEKLDLEKKEKEIAIATHSEIPRQPVSESLQKAANYLKKDFGSLDHIIGCLRTYAQRNVNFHSRAKKAYDEGNFVGLHNNMVLDLQTMNGFNLEAADRKQFRDTLKTIEQLFFRHFSWKINGTHQLSLRAEKMESRGGEILDMDGNSIPLTEDQMKNLRSQDRAREKRIRESESESLVVDAQADVNEAVRLVNELRERSGEKPEIREEVLSLLKVLRSIEEYNKLLEGKVLALDGELDSTKSKLENAVYRITQLQKELEGDDALGLGNLDLEG